MEDGRCMLWKRRPLVKLETMRCRFGPISTRKRPAAWYRQSGKQWTWGHAHRHIDTHTPRRCSPVVSTRAALRPKKRLKESETRSFSVRGTTPPISPRTSAPPARSSTAGHATLLLQELPPAGPPLTSQHDDPGQWYWFCATASTGMAGVASMFVAPGR